MGEWLQAARAFRAMEMKYEAEKAVCSEDLTTMAEPVKSVEIMGERAL